MGQVETLIESLLQETPRGKYGGLYGAELTDTETGPLLLSLDRGEQARGVALLLDRLVELDHRVEALGSESEQGQGSGGGPGWESTWNRRWVALMALRGLMRRKLPLEDETLRGLVEWTYGSSRSMSYSYPLTGLASAVEQRAAEGVLPKDLAQSVLALVDRLRAQGNDEDARKAADRLAKAVAEGPAVYIRPGEAWSDVALADLEGMDSSRRQAWLELLASCQEAGRGKPTASWLKKVRPLVETVGRDELKGLLLRWLPLVDKPRTRSKPRASEWEPQYDDLIEPQHVELLKGLAYVAGQEADRDLARVLSALSLSAYRKVPGKGPRLVSLGHAAVAALGAMPGMEAIGQLAMLKVKVKFIPAQKEIEKALSAAAVRQGLPLEEIEELGVPAYGLEDVGRRRENLGDYVGEIVIDGPDAELRWSKQADGKPLKSMPAAVKKEHAADVKELQAAVKDIGRMLTAQRERIDSLFLARKTWPEEAWRQRYLDHPLVGTIARRLIWRFQEEGSSRDAFWLDGSLVGVDDQPIPPPGGSATVELWHPIGQTLEQVTAWRDFLDRHQIRQPFKQAHREVYLLTDAERATRVYSNRFAAHILRQHQYHALCAARGWRNRLRLMVDDTYPPSSKDLPAWGLRAEFWVEGIGDDYGSHTTDSGAYLHLSTDQVRFYELGAPQRQAHAGGGGYSPGWNRVDAEPVPLEDIPPLVLSEILRDVDLFVGVASVGNDPTWSDGGPDGRYANYWQSYSFGDLSANGETRKAVLERLIPRLRIAPQCSFSDRFLVVRGKLRTYKIHLGSGNILMEPNDQYLCIVPKRSSDNPQADGSLFLPFEGDNTLSIILSKALLLADDTKISDPTIMSQIKR